MALSLKFAHIYAISYGSGEGLLQGQGVFVEIFLSKEYEIYGYDPMSEVCPEVWDRYIHDHANC